MFISNIKLFLFNERNKSLILLEQVQVSDLQIELDCAFVYYIYFIAFVMIEKQKGYVLKVHPLSGITTLRYPFSAKCALKFSATFSSPCTKNKRFTLPELFSDK